MEYFCKILLAHSDDSGTARGDHVIPRCLDFLARPARRGEESIRHSNISEHQNLLRRPIFSAPLTGSSTDSKMTQADHETGNEDSGYDEGLAGGPGAPMPLTQLAVSAANADTTATLTT